VEWVETTGKTVEDAKEQALDELGVDDQDAEFEIVEEAKAGLFGLVRKEARVRARVRPTQPRPKVERRRSRRRDGAERGQRNGSGSGSSRDTDVAATVETTLTGDEGDLPANMAVGKIPASKVAAVTRGAGSPARGQGRSRRREGGTMGTDSEARDTGGRKSSGSEHDSKNDRDTTGTAGGGRSRATKGNEEPMDEITLDQQLEVMEDFLDGLVEAFGLNGQVSSEHIDDDIVEIRIEGDDLGLLIGPKGQTLAAVQELSRTVAQRRLAGPHQGRVRLDVSGYRKRRAEALTRFALQVAEDVKETGTPKVLEPMSPPDRKVVHDALNDVDGVRTASEGEDSRRRVVVLPD
jgi:spoIIIJ-associated protein